MATPLTDTIRDLQRMQVHPSKIRKGDLLRDLGRLREVDHVEALDEVITENTLHLIMFVEDTSEIGSLGVREVSAVTIWRRPEC